MKSKVLLGLIITLVFTFAVGCGGTPQSSEKQANNNTVTKEAQANEPMDLILKDSHYSIENGYVHYTIAIENPNAKYMPEFVKVKVTGKKTDGSIGFSDEWTISSLAPGSTSYWASQAGDGNTAEEDTIEISLVVDKNSWQKSDPKPADLYVFNNVSVSQETFGGMKSTGEITLTDASVDYGFTGVTQPMLVCVFKNAEGKLVGGFSGYVDSDLSEGVPYVFDISSFHNIGEYATVEMYANPWI